MGVGGGGGVVRVAWHTRGRVGPRLAHRGVRTAGTAARARLTTSAGATLLHTVVVTGWWWCAQAVVGGRVAGGWA